MSTFDTHDYADGTSLTQTYPFGSYVTARVMCADGRVRTVKRITDTADTVFSVPCAVAVAGRTVSGYLTVEARSGASTATGHDPAVVKFAAHDDGRNADALPDGLWRSERPATRTLAVRITYYYDDGFIMFDEQYGEDEAGRANVFGSDDTCVVALTRSPRGRWIIDTSDYGHTLPLSAYRRRFATVVDAIDYMSTRTGITLHVVDDWDDADPDHESYELDVCTDCLLLLTDGDVPEDRIDLPQQIEKIWPTKTYVLSIGSTECEACSTDDADCEPWFSWQPCDTCNSSLGGDRHHATAHRRKAGVSAS